MVMHKTYYLGLDDSDDILKIGLGSSVERSGLVVIHFMLVLMRINQFKQN